MALEFIIAKLKAFTMFLGLTALLSSVLIARPKDTSTEKNVGH